MVTEKISVRRTAGIAATLALSVSLGSLTACGSGPAPTTTTTTRSVTTDTTVPAAPQQQTTTVQKTTTTQ